jgi:hypothetical protein
MFQTVEMEEKEGINWLLWGYRLLYVMGTCMQHLSCLVVMMYAYTGSTNQE